MSREARFDGYEVNPVHALDAHGKVVEWGEGEAVEVCERAEAQRWALYGHLPEGGVENIADFEEEEHAEAAADALDMADGVVYAVRKRAKPGDRL